MSAGEGPVRGARGPDRPRTSRVVSAWLGAIDGRTWWSRDDREPHLAASTMKLPVAMAAHRRHERGELDLDAEVEVRDELPSAVPGRRFTVAREGDEDQATWEELGTGVALRTLVQRMLRDSGNLAANLVLERVGPTEVARVLEEAGCSPRTQVRRGVLDLEASRAGIDNVVTARDLGLVLCGLAGRTLTGLESAREIEADLAARTQRRGLPSAVPDGVRVVGKPGWVSGVNHDVAIVRPGDHAPFVLSVLTRHGASEDDGWALVERVAARAWEALEQRVGRPLHVSA